MKIMHVIDSSGVWGAEKMLISLAKSQIEFGDEVVVLSMGKPKEEKKFEKALQQEGIPYIALRFPLLPRIHDIIDILTSVKNFFPDVIHSHGYKGNILFGLILAKKIKFPVIATLHGWVSLPGDFTKLRLYEYLDSWAIQSLDFLVLVTENMNNKKFFERCERKAIKRSKISNGIMINRQDKNGFLKDKLVQFKKDRKLIGSIGRLSKEKGYNFLIEAFSKINEKNKFIALVILGDGQEKSNLEKLVKSYSLENHVCFLGYVENAASLLDVFDIYVCSSMTEGMPITLLEAMAMRIPIVSTAVGEIPKMLNFGEAGELVAPGDYCALANGIQKVIESPQDYVEKSIRAYDIFAENFSCESMMNAYRDVYKTVLSLS